jgi:hypothetical protein
MSTRLNPHADTVSVRVQGIPCQALVTRCFTQPALGPSADSDWDCYGYSEVEFDLYDLKGYRALWLERKMTDKDVQAIEEEILSSRED